MKRSNKILQSLRKPYLALFLGSLILFTSCNPNQLELATVKNKVDYSAFEKIKNETKTIDRIIKKVKSQVETNKASVLEVQSALLNEINAEFKTNLVLPPEVLAISTNELNSQQILEMALNYNWINKNDFELINSFSKDLQTEGFDKAISNYEQIVETTSLSVEELTERNLFLNGVKALEHENPELFEFKTNRGPWGCILASIALVGAIAGTSSCATIVACGVALVALYFAIDNVGRQCFR